MTVGLEPVCCAGAGTADANTTKNKGRTLTSLLFIRTSRFEELPNSPRLLRTMLPSYCPLGRACTVLWARLRIQSTHESRLIGSRGGPRKTVGLATEFSLSAKMILLIGSDKPEGCRKDPTGYMDWFCAKYGITWWTAKKVMAGDIVGTRNGYWRMVPKLLTDARETSYVI